MNISRRFPRLLTISLIAVGATVGRAPAQEKAAVSTGGEKSSTAPAKVEATAAADAKVSPSPKPHALPKGIEEIVRMSEAGLAPEVLTRFIENSGLAYEPTGADLIAMKRRGVPDDVMVVMLAKSSAIKAEYDAARKKIAAPAIVRTLSTDGQLDPESYEFFWFHHAYPRALAGSYQTLSPYTQSYYYRGSRKTHDPGPKWRTDGFARGSFTPSVRNPPRSRQ